MALCRCGVLQGLGHVDVSLAFSLAARTSAFAVQVFPGLLRLNPKATPASGKGCSMSSKL